MKNLHTDYRLLKNKSPDCITSRCLLRERPEIIGEKHMLAVIKTGGKQYRVTQGEVLRVEKIELETGQTVELDQVLMLIDGEKVKLGAPTLAGAKVKAEVVSHGRAKKIEIIKFKRRKHHRKQMGHRQWFTELKVTSIEG